MMTELSALSWMSILYDNQQFPPDPWARRPTFP
jgi:hypothetical protein